MVRVNVDFIIFLFCLAISVMMSEALKHENNIKEKKKKKICPYSMNTITIFISCTENFQILLVLRTREKTDVFIILDENIYGIQSKRANILRVYILT